MLAVYFATRWGKFLTKSGLSLSRPEPEQLELPGFISDTDYNAENLKVDASLEKTHNLPVLPLLLFWGFASLVAYSLAGEKMPWLTVHITPGIHSGCRLGVGLVSGTTNWKEVSVNAAY